MQVALYHGHRSCIQETKRLGVEHNGVQLARMGCNGQNGCKRVVRGVSLDCDLSVQDPMGQDRSGSEGLLECIEGGTTLISKVPRNILVCEVCEQDNDS